jgi:hypothetical protein
MSAKLIITAVFCIIQVCVIGQKKESSYIQHIDSLILSKKNYTDIQSSGIIHKRILGIIKKRVGSLSKEVLLNDTLIYSITNIYHYEKGEELVEKSFYYHNNKLIKYENRLIKKANANNGDILIHEVIVYFKNNEIAGTIFEIKDNYVFDKSEQDKVIANASSSIERELGSLRELKKIYELKQK